MIACVLHPAVRVNILADGLGLHCWCSRARLPLHSCRQPLRVLAQGWEHIRQSENFFFFFWKGMNIQMEGRKHMVSVSVMCLEQKVQELRAASDGGSDVLLASFTLKALMILEEKNAKNNSTFYTLINNKQSCCLEIKTGGLLYVWRNLPHLYNKVTDMVTNKHTSQWLIQSRDRPKVLHKLEKMINLKN